MKNRWKEGFVLALLVLSAAYFIRRLTEAAQSEGVIRAFDIYAYFYPIMVQAARSVRDGGQGLFWNPYQDCGQPLFGGGLTGLLYPPGVLSLLLPPDAALLGLLCFNLAVGSIGAYFLCRELGTGRIAAWCGALTFGFSNVNIGLIGWTPLVSGPYAWFPAAMLFCERLLRQPTVLAAAGLGASIALALAPGHPQGVFFLYQLIGLRLVWQFVIRRESVRGRTLAFLVTALVVGPLLCAVQFIPYVEVMRNSIRSAALQAAEIETPSFQSWAMMRQRAIARSEMSNPFMLVPFIVGSVAIVQSRLWRHVLFYVAVGFLSLDLSLGTNGWLFPYYVELPLAGLFRAPARFLWVSAFCIAVVVALATDAIVGRERIGTEAVRRAAILALSLGVTAAFDLLVGGLRWTEWAAAIPALGGCAVAVLFRRAGAVAGVLIAVALFANLVYFRPPTTSHLLPSGDVLFARAELFHDLRERMTPQDRLYLVAPRLDFSLQQKTGSLFEVPSLFDYEVLPSRRYADYFNMLRTGLHPTSVNRWFYPIEGFLPAGMKTRLLDLAAARFLVVSKGLDKTDELNLPVRLVVEQSDLRVYENTAVLPRAHFVSRIELVSDPSTLLSRLANGKDDLRHVALVEEDFPSGFKGGPAPRQSSAVEFLRNDPEHLELRVKASQRGFVFLADQYFPGWYAWVNGESTPIRRANYAFRIVEVPQGDSVVEFRYRPMSIGLGALVSVLTLFGSTLALIRSRRRGYRRIGNFSRRHLLVRLTEPGH